MTDDLRPPFRQQFDNARDPYTARNALGITTLGGGGSGNVSNSGTPTAGQYAKWVTATTIQGVAPATVLSDIGAQPAGSYQPLDADLTAIAALTGTNTIYYRSAANTWSAITVNAGLTFTGGVLDRAALTGDVTAPANSAATTIANDAVTYAKMQNVSAASLLIGRGSAAGAGDPQEITLGTNLSMSGTTLNATSGGGGTATPVPPQGRLTLQTATPVMTTTQSAKTTIFYTPYVGDQVVLYSGTAMVPTTFTELSNVTTASSTGSAGPAAVAASSIYDLFVWSNGGTVTLTRGPAWTNDTTRAAGTALVRQNGIWLNNAAITNGPAASRGTYVGTVRSNASSQIDWIYGTLAAGGTAGFFALWNAYNRVPHASLTRDSTDSWAISNANWHAANGSNSMRCSIVRGLDEDAVTAQYTCTFSINTNNAAIGVALDSVTTSSGTDGGVLSGTAMYTTPTATYIGLPGIGFHFLQATELSAATATFLGDGAVGYIQNGLTTSFMA